MTERRGQMRSIDRGSPIPYYYQLQEILKQEIDNGRWQPGQLLPSEAEMTAIFGVSRSVTRKALDILEGDGQVHRVKGKGTLVAQPKFRYEAIAMAREWGVADVVEPALASVVALQRVAVSGHVGRLLDLKAGADVFELTFVHSVDGVPSSLAQMFLRTDATPALADTSIPVLVEGGANAADQLQDLYGLNIAESRLTIEATRANRFEAEKLDIETDSPVFLVASVDVDPDDNAVSFTRSVVRGDQFRFTAVVRRKDGDPSLVAPAFDAVRSPWFTDHHGNYAEPPNGG